MSLMTDTCGAPRTMWRACRDLLDEAFRTRDAEMWGRAYRLWMLASAMRAPGEPFCLMAYHARWLPTAIPQED